MSPTTHQALAEPDAPPTAPPGPAAAAPFRVPLEEARAVLSGQRRPEPLPMSAGLREWLDKCIADYPRRPTPEALQHKENNLALMEVYGGCVVLRTVDESVPVAVLANGYEGIFSLLAELTPEEQRKVGTEHVQPL